MRLIRIICLILPAALLNGCLSVGSIEPSWVIHVDGDVAVAVGALERSASANGGKPLNEVGPTGATYMFGGDLISFRVNGTSVIAMGWGAAYGNRSTEYQKRHLNKLIGHIVELASRDSRLPMQLSPQSVPHQLSLPGGHGSAQLGAGNDRFKEYGTYLGRVADTVQQQFDAVVDKTNIYPPQGSWVTITFILAPDGGIARIVAVDSHTTPNGDKLALSALTGRAPFEPWTPEMKAKLGPTGEKLIFTFYYE